MKNSSRECKLVDDRGDGHYISYSKYKEIAKRWENYKYGTQEIVTRSSGYTTHGDKYNRPGYGNRHWVFFPPDKIDKSEPIVTEHTYENRLQTQSHWGKVSDKDRVLYDVFDYPSVPGGWRLTSILTNGKRYPKADMRLQYYNAYLNTNKGGYKKVRMWILVYHNQPQESAELQRAYWKDANKNEVVVMIGTKDGEIAWADVMAQTTDAKSEAMKIEIRNTLLVDMREGKNGWSRKLDDGTMLKFVDYFAQMVHDYYTKPDFHQYDYIQVQPSLFAIMISLIVVLIVNVGAAAFVIINPWGENSRHKPRYRTGGYRFR